MANSSNYSNNLGLPQTPKGVADDEFSEFNRIYQAINTLGNDIESLRIRIVAIETALTAANLRINALEHP